MTTIDTIIADLPSDPLSALFVATERISQLIYIDEFNSQVHFEADYQFLIDCLAIIATLSEKASYTFKLPILDSDEERNTITAAISIKNFQKTLSIKHADYKTKTLLPAALEKYKTILSDGFFYEFSDGDLARIQELINELRNELTESSLFEEDHKRRILQRLEKLQAELHKKMSSLDGFWGLFGDAGVALGKFGTEVKPLTDRIQDIMKIVWRSQARAEELPSDLPMPLEQNKLKTDK